MSSRISFADLLKAGAEKEKKRLNLQLAPPAPSVPPAPSSSPQSVAPEKDFSKMPNSIKRAVEEGKFPNSSLTVYLFLYSLTRGAIQPKRSVQVNKPKLSAGTGLRSEKALTRNLAHLRDGGFVKITLLNGDRLGNEFEVFIPEEIEGEPTYLPTYPPTYLPTYLPTDERLVGRWVQTKENKGTYGDPKTIKNKKKKSEPETGVEPAGGFLINILFDVFFKIVRSRARENQDPIQISLSDAKGQPADWQKLGELLAMELEIAAARTNSISNVPAFLTEHLRRRLARKPDSRAANKIFGAKTTGKSSPLGKADDCSKTDVETYQAEPLTEHARETVLKTMREYVEKGQRDFVSSLQDTYTADDWKWLTENLPDEAAGK